MTEEEATRALREGLEVRLRRIENPDSPYEGKLHSQQGNLFWFVGETKTGGFKGLVEPRDLFLSGKEK